MPETKIRAVRETDLIEILDIYVKEVLEGTASFEIQPPGLNEMTSRMHVVCVAKLPYLVAELEGKVAGFAYAVPYRPRQAYRYTVENSVYVARWAQRQGVGSCLLEALVEACERAGARQMIAIIGGASHTASVRVHEKAGFQRVGTLEKVGWKFGRWLDTLVMQRSLGAADARVPRG
jgi:phosphinothricin acetyltransferase